MRKKNFSVKIEFARDGAGWRRTCCQELIGWGFGVMGGNGKDFTIINMLLACVYMHVGFLLTGWKIKKILGAFGEGEGGRVFSPGYVLLLVKSGGF